MSKFVIFLLMLSPSLWAKKFTNHYIEFELPPGWSCNLEGSEWLCNSSNKDRQREAVIILAAKIRSAEDSLDQYFAYLKNNKHLRISNQRDQISDSKYTKYNTVNDHKWVDSLHLASELPGFYTRYMATIKDDLGIVFTFSVSKDSYESYQKIIENLVKTLRVFKQKSTSVADMQLRKELKEGKSSNLLSGSFNILPDSTDQKLAPIKKQAGLIGKITPTNIVIFLVIAGAAFFFYRKSRKK